MHEKGVWLQVEQMSSERWRESPGQACPPSHQDENLKEDTGYQTSIAQEPPISESFCWPGVPCHCTRRSHQVRVTRLFALRTHVSPSKSLLKTLSWDRVEQFEWRKSFGVHVSSLSASTKWASRRERTQLGLTDWYEKQVIRTAHWEKADTLRASWEEGLTKQGFIQWQAWPVMSK